MSQFAHEGQTDPVIQTTVCSLWFCFILNTYVKDIHRSVWWVNSNSGPNGVRNHSQMNCSQTHCIMQIGLAGLVTEWKKRKWWEELVLLVWNCITLKVCWANGWRHSCLQQGSTLHCTSPKSQEKLMLHVALRLVKTRNLYKTAAYNKTRIKYLLAACMRQKHRGWQTDTDNSGYWMWHLLITCSLPLPSFRVSSKLIITCTGGGFVNFMHFRRVSSTFSLDRVYHW